mgnify:CR=1 FL=1
MATRELIAKVPTGRAERQPMGQRNRLKVKNRNPDYHYRIFTDVDDRLEDAKLAGYEIDPDNNSKSVMDLRVDVPNGMGAHGIPLGQGTKGVVMRIPKKWYQEDSRVKQDAIDAVENTIKQTAEKYTRGGLEITSE